MLNRMRVILEELDARIHEAMDCWQLMSLLLSSDDRFDLVISDIGLLKASGLDALFAARAAGIDVPFLFIATHDTPALHARAARLGARILHPSVAAHQLLTSVEQMCGSPYPRGPGIGVV